MSSTSLATSLLLGCPLIGGALAHLLEEGFAGHGLAEVIMVTVVAPLVIWLIKRQDRRESEQAKRRDKLLTTQVLMQRRLANKVEGLGDKLDHVCEKLDELPAKIVLRCNTPGGNCT